MLKVIKFGGSSLACADCFLKAAEAVGSDADCRFVVVSAPGKRKPGDEKITDLLKSYCFSGEKNASVIIKKIERRMKSITRSLGLGTAIAEESLCFAGQNHVRGFEDCDYIIGRGEYFSACVMSRLLGFQTVDGGDIIAFDDGGTFDPELSVSRAAKTLAGRNNAVIPGFYGRKDDGTVKVLPRGGSDVTGAVAARAVDADLYCNCTDVDGVYCCNPQLAANPPVAGILTYGELYGLALAGAKVVHPTAVSVLQGSGVPILVKNAFGRERGTLVVPEAGNADFYRKKFGFAHCAGKSGIDGISGRGGIIAAAGVGIMKNTELIGTIQEILLCGGIASERTGIFCNRDCVAFRVKPSDCDNAVRMLYRELFRKDNA